MGGGSNSASKAAEQREKEAQARIQAGTSRVNQVFDSPERQAQYQQYLDAARGTYRKQLDEKKGDADRNLKFALARGGQTGGSVQIGQANELGKQYQTGLLDVERGAQGDVAGIRAADEDSRARLIGQVQGGLDQNTGAMNAATALQNNLQAGTAAMKTNAFGDAFGSFAKLYANSKEQAEYRRGLKQGVNLYGAPAAAGGGW